MGWQSHAVRDPNLSRQALHKDNRASGLVSRAPERNSHSRAALVAFFRRAVRAYVCQLSWVAPAALPDGTRAVLKIGMPHLEAEQEIEGLRFWDGRATVKVLESEQSLNAMLLEHCEPGTLLRSIPETEQDPIPTTILKRLWLKPPPQQFRPLSAMITYWNECTRKAQAEWSDPALINQGSQVLTAMASEPTDNVLLTTDLHSGNILRAQREPWLTIDPKPFVGDPTYDLTRLSLTAKRDCSQIPAASSGRVASLADLNERRVLL
jgi:streptomycin 6-kinase